MRKILVIALSALMLTACYPTSVETTEPPSYAETGGPTVAPEVTDEIVGLGMTLEQAKNGCITVGVEGNQEFEMLWEEGESTVEMVDGSLVLTYRAEVVRGPGAPKREPLFRCTFTQTAGGGFDLTTEEI